MSQQYIQSPGVQINEVDLSLRVSSPLGVGVLAMGFTNQGPTDEVIQVTSIEEYESLYGKPQTAAERYSYHTIKALFDSPANIYFSRLPYGGDDGNIFSQDKYSALVYPVIPNTADDLDTPLSADNDLITDFYITKPYHIELSRLEYEAILDGNIDWQDSFGLSSGFDNLGSSDQATLLSSIGHAGLVVLNTSKTTINEQFEGYYLGISDNRNTDPSSDYTDVIKINSINDIGDNLDDYTTIPSQRLNFQLSASNSNVDSMSEVMESIPSFNIGTEEFTDMLSIGLFKLRKTPFTNSEIALSYALTESYVGSFDPDRELQNPTGGPNQSVFLETIDNVSNNVRFFVNPNLQNVFTLNLSASSEDDTFIKPKKKLRVLSPVDLETGGALSSLSSTLSSETANEAFPVGIYQSSRGADKTIGSIPTKVERVLDLVENPDLFELDILVEAGLGTIFCSTQSEDLSASGIYDETATWDNSLSSLRQRPGGTLPQTAVDYNTIFTTFNGFCENRRKDCMFIADPIRQIFITGENSRVLTQTYQDVGGNNIVKNFSSFIYNALANQFAAANSSYAAVYGNWVKVFDGASNKQVWVPYSGFAASLMARMDYVWEAPAGLTRGLNNNINDIALYPKQKERDQLYKISVNPLAFFPNEGFVTWGQKTLQSKPSAFDRINVRRVFLFLEKATLRTSKYFVFEPNTLFTRTQVVNVLSPLFENVKNKDGIRDYIIVCSEKNNTDEVIEQNQLKIDIYIKPTKIAEFILIDFIATRQDANFQELIG
jgi:hypothetical protein